MSIEIDYGTKAVASDAVVTVTIDGLNVSVPAGTSVMRAAAEAGIAIPKLCATDRLDAFGSCRMCVVEIDGRKGTPASCTTPCEDAMSCSSQSPLAAQVRQSSGWSEM